MADGVKDYPPYLDYPKPRKKQTNADRIRAMTDEKLANFLISTCPQHGQQCNDPFYDCVACWLDWLKQEVSDNGKD